MKKKIIYILIILSIIITLISLSLMFTNKQSKNKFEIIDATYACSPGLDLIYEDSEYKYYLTCKKSNSVYIKNSNGNKYLIKDALNNNIITIEELLNTEIEIYKEIKK